DPGDPDAPRLPHRRSVHAPLPDRTRRDDSRTDLGGIPVPAAPRPARARAARCGHGTRCHLRDTRRIPHEGARRRAGHPRPAADTGLAAIFAIPDAFHMRALAAEMGTGGPLRTYPLVGELFPAHAGATSKAYYATLPDRERQRIFADRPMARFTPSTTVDPAALEQQFEKIRRQGYATSAGEYDRDVSTVAMVVRLRNESFGSLSLGQHGEFRTDVPTLVRFLESARRE